MTLGLFPDDWKIARVTPSYKDGSEDENSDYRVSVLTVISRPLERLVYVQFYGFLKVNKFLFSHQFRSVSGQSCKKHWNPGIRFPENLNFAGKIFNESFLTQVEADSFTISTKKINFLVIYDEDHIP